WLPASASPIREDNTYGGTQFKVTALLDKVRIYLQIDVGFGDAITPEQETHTWPGMLDYQDCTLSTYPVETAIAEKLEAMVTLGAVNSRMKDFYDLHWLTTNDTLAQETLRQAISNTFKRRETPIPTTPPHSFTKAFYLNKDKIAQWKGFL